MAYLQDRVRRYVQEAPEAEVYNVWADDTAEDASTWCFCPQCQGYSPSDQNLLVMNAMAEAVRDVKPTAKLVCIAYHETIAAPEKVAPAPNVVLMYAPRERCYAHPLDDPECAKNRQHAQWLENLVKVFDPGQAEIFEYYPDQVVFNHMLPALADTIAGDVRYYKRLGIGLIEPLLTPFTHPWITPPPSAILQSRALWSLDADLHEVLADYARTYFGDEIMVDYFRHRERALQRVIRACDFPHPVAAFWTPPLDNPGATARHLEGLEASLGDLRAARAYLARASRVTAPEYAGRIHNEETAFNLASRRVNGQIHYARGVLAHNRFEESKQRQEADEAVRHFEHAYADLNESLLRNDQLHRTFRFADGLIHRLLAETGQETGARLSASQVVGQLPAALIPARADELAGTYQLHIDGGDGGTWTVTLLDRRCTVSEGEADEPVATLEMQADEFVAWMCGEVAPRALLWARSKARLTGDAVRLMNLPTAFRL
jgi:hypothetical protein